VERSEEREVRNEVLLNDLATTARAGTGWVLGGMGLKEGDWRLAIGGLCVVAWRGRGVGVVAVAGGRTGRCDRY
jgi:hypothetical protein